MLFNHLREAGIQHLAVGSTHACENSQRAVVVDIRHWTLLVDKYHLTPAPRPGNSPSGLDHVEKFGEQSDESLRGLF